MFAMFVMAVSPLSVSAQTAGGSVQDQIQSLLQQISALQERLKALQAATGSASGQVCSPMMKLACSQAGASRVGIGCDPRCVPGAVTEAFSSTNNDTEPVVGGGYVGGQCPRIARTLQRGAQGTDVRDLQEFLRSHGVLSTSATGFFGQQTEDAIRGLQQQYGVSGGLGILGPKTTALIAQLCGGIGGGSAGSNLKATPGFGKAPLAVSFTASTGPGTSTVSIDYGDGVTEAMLQGSCIAIAAVVGGQGGIRCSYGALHSYPNPGTYTAKATRQGNAWCPPQGMGMPCMMGTSTVPVGAAVITVVSSTTPDATLSITAPAPGLTIANGSTVTVSWQSTAAPQGATVSLALVGASSTGEQIIARGKLVSGSFQWYLTGYAIPMMMPGSASGSPVDVIKSYASGAAIGCPVGMDGGPSAFRCGGGNGGYIKPGVYSLVARMYVNDSLVTFSPGVSVTVTGPVPDHNVSLGQQH